uniref:Uncharacterized protein n=1 Tax=Takifugu rubripes TaxID=31033 RepID=A0A674NDG4_TAKRU
FFLDFSPLDHSTSSLTDTNTSLSSSDNDHSSRTEHGIPIGRCTFSSEDIHRPTMEVSESEAAKEVHEGSRMPSHKHKEKYALGIITLFPSLRDPFSPKGYLDQDSLLLFGTETASKMLEKWDTTLRLKVINEAKQLTQSIELAFTAGDPAELRSVQKELKRSLKESKEEAGGETGEEPDQGCLEWNEDNHWLPEERNTLS